MNANISFIHKIQSTNDITTIAGASQEIMDALQKTVQHAGALLGVRNCSIALLDGTGTTLVTLAALQPDGQKPRQTRFRLNEGVAGWVAEHREALIINDTSLDPRFKRLGHIPLNSIMCVPLLSNDNMIGTLTVSSRQNTAFDEKQAHLLSTFAHQAVLTILNTRHAEIAQRQINSLEMLLRLSRGVTTRLEPATLYRTILLNARQLVPCDSAVIYLVRERAHELYSVANLAGHDVLSLTDVKEEKINLYDEHSLPAWAALHRHPMLLAAVQSMQDEEGIASSSPAELAAPFVSRNVLYGVLSLKREGPFTSEEFRIVRNLCNIAAATLENMQLFHKVRSEQEELSAILASSSDGIATLGIDARFDKANAAFGRIFGVAAEQIVGMECLELLSCRDKKDVSHCRNLCMIQEALLLQEPLPYLEIDLSIQDVPRSIGLSITPVITADKPLCLLVVRDVTTIRDTTRMKANFLSMITHELRSPINAINGYLDLALEGIAGELNSQQREFIQRARASSEHLYALVEDLLLVSRADAGQLRLNRDLTRLQDVIANAVEEMELTAADHGVAIAVDIARDFPYLYADTVRLQQVLRNLLSNALHFTAQGGQVTISAHIESEAPSETAPSEEVTHVVKLCVRDTGSGIAHEHHLRIFERFFQVSKGSSGGQGLGLAIVKMIVELHGGTVTVESIPDQGSTFICTLPCLLV
jgi:PAS domain S-box-containing protein